MTKSPLSDWLTYACTALDITTVSIIGFTGSDTKACNGLDSIGKRKPAIAATTPELPAVTQATFLAPIKPCVVCTPTTAPSSVTMSVTSHC